MPKPDHSPFFVDREVIVLTANGVWIADGTEISHEPTRRLFAKSLKRDAEGYFLHIGRETKRIEVQDTAYFVSGIDGAPSAGFTLRLSDETREKLDPRTLAYRPGRLTCRIKNGTEEAKLLHTAYHELLKHLEKDKAGYFLLIEGTRAQLAPAESEQPR